MITDNHELEDPDSLFVEMHQKLDAMLMLLQSMSPARPPSSLAEVSVAVSTTRQPADVYIPGSGLGTSQYYGTRITASHNLTRRTMRSDGYCSSPEWRSRHHRFKERKIAEGSRG